MPPQLASVLHTAPNDANMPTSRVERCQRGQLYSRVAAARPGPRWSRLGASNTSLNMAGVLRPTMHVQTYPRVLFMPHFPCRLQLSNGSVAEAERWILIWEVGWLMVTLRCSSTGLLFMGFEILATAGYLHTYLHRLHTYPPRYFTYLPRYVA